MNLSWEEWLGVTLLEISLVWVGLELTSCGWITPLLIDSSWLTLVWFESIELELLSLVYISMFDLLGLGGCWRFFWMVFYYGCSYLWWWELGKLVHLRNHELSAMWIKFVLEALWYCTVLVVSPKNSVYLLCFHYLDFSYTYTQILMVNGDTAMA